MQSEIILNWIKKMKLSEKKQLEIANVCYANVACDFAMMINEKYRGPNFTWQGWIDSCEQRADAWMMVHVVSRDKESVNAIAKKFAREIAETLVERAELRDKPIHHATLK